MIRVLKRSMLEPLRNAGTAFGLLASMVALWFAVALTVVLTSAAMDVQYAIEGLLPMSQTVMAIPVLMLTLPVVYGESRDRTLQLQLMQPVDRVSYYFGRVLGTALASLVYFAVTLAVLYGLVSWMNRTLYGDEWQALPADFAVELLFAALSLVSVTFSLCALAPIATFRWGHLVYWAGLYVIVAQARGLADADASTASRVATTLVREVLQPFVVGPDPDFVGEAALGPWFFGRALLQWAFGLCLALVVGSAAFSRMEVARR